MLTIHSRCPSLTSLISTLPFLLLLLNFFILIKKVNLIVHNGADQTLHLDRRWGKTARMMIMMMIINTLTFWLSEHPTIVGFRWSHAQSWGSTWSFLFTSILIYLTLSLLLHLTLSLLIHPRPISLGPIPAVHSLTMALISATIFAGTLLSAAAEIRETRWLWRRSKLRTPLQWLLCFPLGTRPSGRVFFWSYLYYLSRFLHMFRTLFTITRRRRLAFFHLLNQSILTFMSFLWLEFSQSFQVLAILSATLVYSAVYGYRFWTAVGLRGACFPFVISCQIALLGCNVACHVGVLMLHFMIKGGCNGIGAWVLNSVLNGVILLLFLNFFVKMRNKKKKKKKKIEKAEGEVIGPVGPVVVGCSGLGAVMEVNEIRKCD